MNGGVPAFVACKFLDHLQHAFCVVGVKDFCQSLLMSPLCLLVASFQSLCGGLISFLVT